MPNSLLQFYHYLYRVAVAMLHWALFLQSEQRNVAKSGQTPAISNSVAIRRHVGKVQKHPEHISKGSESPQIEKTMQHFLSQYNVELIPENSGTENCKFWNQIRKYKYSIFFLYTRWNWSQKTQGHRIANLKLSNYKIQMQNFLSIDNM